MTTFRKVIFANDQVYHIFNRGVERRDVFTNRRDYIRALETLKYYRFSNLPKKLSKFLVLPKEERVKFMSSIADGGKQVEILAFCLMPNHFHFLLRQIKDDGVPKFISNFSNSYTKYFNTRSEREGPLFQGLFKAVMIETDEQLVHVSRYIHLNPISSFLIREDELKVYPWSSYPEYLGKNQEKICNIDEVLNFFPTIDKYKEFVSDQISYAQELDKIKHLVME